MIFKKDIIVETAGPVYYECYFFASIHLYLSWLLCLNWVK